MAPNTLEEWIKTLEPIPLYDGFKISNQAAKELREFLKELKRLRGGTE